MKAAANYSSIIRGVSEQAPELRPEGQLTEQVNMSSDPVQGLSRRFPTVFQAEQSLVETNYANVVADTANWRTFDYFSQGIDYTLCVRRAARVATGLPVMLVYNRTAGSWLTVARNTVDANLDLLQSGGVSAMTSIGKYVFLAGNSLTATLSSTDVWGSNDNLEKALVWIRGGAYARTYSVTATKFDNSQVTFSYKTPTSSYQTALDISGIPGFVPDTSGATPGTGPSRGSISDPITMTPTGVDQFGVAHYEGTSFTLTHAADNPGNLSVTLGTGTTTDNYQLLTFHEGIDFMKTGTGIYQWLPWLGGVDQPNGGINYGMTFADGRLPQATYNYDVGGTSATAGYVTEQAVETLYVKNVGNYGFAELAYREWNPVSLILAHGLAPMTNVYPAQPAAAGEYSWPGENKPVILSPELVNNNTIVAIYTHTKVMGNPNYSKQSNDVTSGYNAAVTKWIGDAAKAIAPDAIAKQLQLAAITAGLTTAIQDGPNIIFDNVKSLSVDDGGDGTLIRGVADEVGAVDQVSTTHAVGKVVKVRGKNSKESFYLIATAKDRTVTTGYTEVIWVEGAGVIQSVDAKLIYGTAIGSTFYLAGSAALLNTLTSQTDIPGYEPSEAGDADTNAPPYFVGRKITYLGTFQDRLLIGCGGVIRTSKVAEYLTFFRATVLSLPANDAMEFLSQSAADDELRYSVLYDQNLVVFGLKRQYLINGHVPLTPTNANMVPMSNHKDAAELPPLAAGDFIFYGKKGIASSSIHQIQPGVNNNSPASYSISSQVDLYLLGDAIELQNLAKPDTLFLRTAGKRSSVYLFSYFDTPQGRKLDAWNRWDYNPAAGTVIGMQPTPEGLLVFSIRNASGVLYAVADLQPMTTGLSTKPYLDSQRTFASFLSSPGSMAGATLSVAYDTSSEWKFLGATVTDDLTDLSDDHPGAPDTTHQWVGFDTDAYFVPTNPFRRDANGKAITTGNLTVGSFVVSFDKSSGYVYDLTARSGTTTYTFNGRVLGSPDNKVGREPVITYVETIAIGEDSESFEFKLKSRKWFPFTIRALAWVGQYFNRTVQF